MIRDICASCDAIRGEICLWPRGRGAPCLTGPDEHPSDKVIGPLLTSMIAAKAMHLPADPTARKGIPIASGVLDYFPLALAEIARVSMAGSNQHHPGQPLHWDKTKSLDHADCIGRHLIDRGTVDADGMRHSAKLAWRALALLQTELENAAK